ncbi:Uncharacterised protein [uncultured archaeon]|nr:Uncharacterised protein [uncultured archaeon]
MLEIIAVIFLSIGAVIAAAVGVGGISRDYHSQKKSTEEMEGIWKTLDKNMEGKTVDNRDYSKRVFYKRPPHDPVSAEYESIMKNLEINNTKADRNSVENYTDIETAHEPHVQKMPVPYTSAHDEKEPSRLDEILALVKNIEGKIGNYISPHKTEKKRDAGTPA